VGFQWRASRRGLEVRNLEVSLQAQADNILVFLGLEEQGHPGMKKIEGRLYVDADGDDDILQELWQETLRRSPVTQSLIREVPMQLEFRRV
jgi:OsmC-like protein